MKTFFRRFSGAAGLRKKRVVVPVLAVLGVLLLGGLWFVGHSGANSVWNTPSTPISDVLDGVDRGNIVTATINGQRILLTDTAGRQSWTIEKESSMGSTEQYLRSHNVKVAVQSTDDASFGSMLPNLVGLLVLLALLFIMLRRSNLMGNPMGAMTKHLAEARVGDGDQVTFDQVVGVDEAKRELEEVVEFLKAPGSFGQLGARMPRGILLVGPPGTGKTLLSRAVAGEAKVPYFSLSGSDFVEMFVGVGAARVRDLFRHAKKNAPCIVFLDEIDALGRKRGGAQIRTNEEREQTLNQLLVEMDGFNTDCAVVVIAATNRPDVLDPALLRSGRFDRRVAIDAPDLNGRRAILSLYAAHKPLAEDIDLDVVARQTPGFTGADLANLLNEAAILAARNKKLAIGTSELEEASLRVMAGPEKRSRMITPEEKAIIAYHEGGHAAEEIIFGDVTTGAKQDIEHATSIARQMVCEFGMSERLGLVTLHRKGDGDSQFFSELTAADVDAEVKALIDAAYRQAYDICHTRRATLMRIAEHLQIVETIDGPELDRLLLEETVPPLIVVSPEVKSAVAARIAAAEAHDWEEPSSGSAHDSEGLPPLAAI